MCVVKNNECNNVGPWNVSIWVGRVPKLLMVIVCLLLCKQLVLGSLGEMKLLCMSYLHLP